MNMDIDTPPKRIGLMVVGLGSDEGLALLETAKNKLSVGHEGQYSLADSVTVGGWDSQPLENVSCFQGLPPSSFGADAPTYYDQVQRLRADIRTFIQGNDIDGHTTVVWSAGEDERPTYFPDAGTLLRRIIRNEAEVPPSMLYAVAASFEGCSFVTPQPSQDALRQVYQASYRIMQPSAFLKRFPQVSGRPAYYMGNFPVKVALDGAAWCDFFHRHRASNQDVTRAAAYLLKNEDDSGAFQRQMQGIRKRKVPS